MKKHAELVNKHGKRGYGHAHTWEGDKRFIEGFCELLPMISAGITRVHLKEND